MNREYLIQEIIDRKFENWNTKDLIRIVENMLKCDLNMLDDTLLLEEYKEVFGREYGS